MDILQMRLFFYRWNIKRWLQNADKVKTEKENISSIKVKHDVLIIKPEETSAWESVLKSFSVLFLSYGHIFHVIWM